MLSWLAITFLTRICNVLSITLLLRFVIHLLSQHQKQILIDTTHNWETSSEWKNQALGNNMVRYMLQTKLSNVTYYTTLAGKINLSTFSQWQDENFLTWAEIVDLKFLWKKKVTIFGRSFSTWRKGEWKNPSQRYQKIVLRGNIFIFWHNPWFPILAKDKIRAGSDPDWNKKTKINPKIAFGGKRFYLKILMTMIPKAVTKLSQNLQQK